MRQDIWSNKRRPHHQRTPTANREHELVGVHPPRCHWGDSRTPRRITQLEREERCLRGAVVIMAVLAGLALVGVGHSLILLDDVSTAQMRTILQIFVVLGIASAISLVTFAILWIRRRYQLGTNAIMAALFTT